MASKYISLRCPRCEGTLEYNEAKKVWICQYCGNEVRLEEGYDGLYTIKDLVRQVLVDIAYVRLDSAQKNLAECQKISASYIGTLIADLCLKIFTLTIPSACPSNQVNNIYGQIKQLYEQIQAVDPAISSEEKALYESFGDCGDAFGVLLLTFESLRAAAHAEFVLKFLDPAQVYSEYLNTNLLNYAIKKKRPDLADAVFANPDHLNCRKALFTLLKRYPDGEKKRTFIASLFARAQLQPADSKSFDAYLDKSDDSTLTKVLVYNHAAEKGMAPSISIVTSRILCNEDITQEQANDMLAAFRAAGPEDAELDELQEEIYRRFKPQPAKDRAQAGDRDFSIYLEQVSPDQMSGKIIAELHQPTSIVTDLALAKYVLFSEDEFDLKLPNCLIFAENNGKPFGTSSVNLQLFDQKLTCNLLQAYILAADDPDDLMSTIIDVMMKQGAKLNAPVEVEGQVVKFSKYAADHKNDFPDTAFEILESQKVYL